MTATKKSCSFLLIFLVASSLLSIQISSAMAKPSAPEFTAKYQNLNYDVPSTYGTDQYTGKTIVLQQGYTIDNRSIPFTIKNQAYPSPPQQSGNISGVFFNFRVKGIYGTEAQWDYYPFAENGWTTNTYGGLFVPLDKRPPAPAFCQSNGQYPTVTITIPGAWRVPKGATLDVQVQVISGQIQPDDKWYYFAGEFGDWSNTQTVVVSDPPTPNDPYSPSTDQYLAPSATVPVFTPQNSTEPRNTFPTPIPAESVSPSQSPTATPMQPNSVTENPIGLDWSIVAFVILFVVVAVLVAVVAFQQRRLSRLGLKLANPE